MSDLQIHPIAYIHTDFTEKFGIPRQSGLVPELTARIVLQPAYRQPEALREIEGFSHLWLIWEFSAVPEGDWHATVRPPRLGGNRRVGVFASRSPFRPNRLGLSCVRLIGVEYEGPEAPVLLVAGADLLDGTPIFDIKPYIPIADCHPDALPGYTAQTREHRLEVDCPACWLERIPEEKRAALLGVLANDPRPGYEDAPEKRYGVSFAGYNVQFRVEGGRVIVCNVEK